METHSEQAVCMNRELSWLKFNERVLEEAESDLTPLCERLSFTSIYQSNLDEFFMVRVGSLVDQEHLSPDVRENKTNMTPAEQLSDVLRTVRTLNARRDFIYAKLLGHIEENGVRLVDFRKISHQESERLERYFDAADGAWTGEQNADEIHYTWEGNNKTSESFFAGGAPVTGKEGAHEIRYEYNGSGKVVRKSFFGADGQLNAAEL